MTKLFHTVLPILLSLYSVNSVASDYIVTQITENAINDDSPTVNDSGKVVWQSGSRSSFEIMTYQNGTVTQLTDNNFQENQPDINNNDQLVWYGNIDAPSVYEIFFHENGETNRLTYAPGSSFVYSNLFPRINDNGYAVWKQFGKIMLYDGVNIMPIAEDVFGSPIPVINNSNQVAWIKGSGVASEVFFYDGSNLVQITDNAIEEKAVQISDQGKLAWLTKDGSDWDVVLFDGLDIVKITDNDRNESVARINSLGHMVWSSWDGTDSEIYFYDGNKSQQITNNNTNDYNASLNDNDTIVWQSGSGSTSQIFVFKDNAVTQLTTEYQPNWAPVISNTGFITWWGTDDGDRDIFLAEPVTALFKAKNLVDFFQGSVTAGSISGSGPGNSARNRLRSYAKWLERLQEFIQEQNISAACSKIRVLLDHSDTDGISQQFVQGASVSQVNELLMELGTFISCSE